MNAYTYIIKCPNGKSYYGYRSANKVSPEDDLWKVYFTSSKPIKELREQYGDAEFIASVDRTFKSAEEAHEYETKFLTENDCIKSDGWLNQQCFPMFAPNTGMKHTEETKKKISEAQKGRKLTEETKRKMSESQKGVRLTEETKKKISEAKKGKKKTDEHRKKLAVAAKGRKHTDETKKKMSEAKKDNIPWNKGKTGVFTEVAIKKMSESQKGIKLSEKTKKKMSESQKKRYAKEKRNKENVSIEIHGY
jgi:hypothetical protein